MKQRVLCVEGGAHPDLDRDCRKAFHLLFENAGIVNKPSVKVCHGRSEAFKIFCHKLAEGDAEVWLLVDSEEPIAAGHQRDPWAHVRAREGDGWRRPDRATDEQLQFMTVCMETWLLSDRDALKNVFKKGFDESKLPSEGADLETKNKTQLQEALAKATRLTVGGKYVKGAHSFKALEFVSPAKLRQLPWAARFLIEMGRGPAVSSGTTDSR